MIGKLGRDRQRADRREGSAEYPEGKVALAPSG
jgi:hypothetical protein